MKLSQYDNCTDRDDNGSMNAAQCRFLFTADEEINTVGMLKNCVS